MATPEPKMPPCTGTTAKGTPRKRHAWTYPWKTDAEKGEMSRSCRVCGITQVIDGKRYHTLRYVAEGD